MLREEVREGGWRAAAATEEHLSALRLLQVSVLAWMLRSCCTPQQGTTQQTQTREAPALLLFAFEVFMEQSSLVFPVCVADAAGTCPGASPRFSPICSLCAECSGRGWRRGPGLAAVGGAAARALTAAPAAGRCSFQLP